MITITTREDFLLEVKKLLPKNSFCVEIGVLNGDFSKQILDIINPDHLVLIDPYETGGESYDSGLTSAYSTNVDFQNILKRFSSEAWDLKVSIIKKYSHEVVNEYPDNYIHFIYHDASHLYDDIKRDLNEWLPKIKIGGLICGHDYIDIKDFGVIQAVDEFIKEHHFEMTIFNKNGGDWALKKKQE